MVAFVFFIAGGRARADHAHPARGRRRRGLPGGLRRAVHDARLDDGLPVRRPGGARGRPVSGAAAGRRGRDRRPAGRARGAVAADQRRHHDVVRLPDLGRRGAGVVVGVRPALERAVFAGRRNGPVDLRGRAGDGRRDAVVGLRDRDGAVAPRAGDDADADAGVHVDDGRDVPDGAVRVPGAAGRARAAVGAAPRRWRARRQRRRRRLPGAVLVLRAPRRVRHVLPVRRHGRRGPRDVLEPAVLRLPRVRRRAAGVLRPLDDGLGAPHVHLRPDHEQVLLAHARPR